MSVAADITRAADSAQASPEPSAPEVAPTAPTPPKVTLAPAPPPPEGTITVTGFARPAAALAVQRSGGGLDRESLLVSNIDGGLLDKDDNGFISKLKPDGTIVALKWIDGAKPDVQLDAPRAMIQWGPELWVADIDVVRRFDPESGKPLGTIPVPGARALSDFVWCDGGGICVADSGLDADLAPTGTPALFFIEGEADTGYTVSERASGSGLGHPSALDAFEDVGIIIASLDDSGTLLVRDEEGRRPVRTIEHGLGRLGGIDYWGERRGSELLLAASWDEHALVEIAVGPSGAVTRRKLLDGLDGPSGLALLWDTDGVAVPLMQSDRVMIVPMARLARFPIPASWGPVRTLQAKAADEGRVAEDMVDAAVGVYVAEGAKKGVWVSQRDLAKAEVAAATLPIGYRAGRVPLYASVLGPLAALDDALSGDGEAADCDEAALVCTTTLRDGGSLRARFAKVGDRVRLIGLLTFDDDAQVAAFDRVVDAKLASASTAP